MSRAKIVAGNWKMNKTLNEGQELVSVILSFDKLRMTDDVTKIIFPPSPLISSLVNTVGSAKHFFVGAQNCNEHDAGAFTGEVSAAMLSSVGCKFVLVGHSERRQYFGETNSIASKKIKLALENNLKVIYCVGERLTERKTNKHFEIVKTQLTEALQSLDPENIIIAYEPVWAIGTGETATPNQAQEMHVHIRNVLENLFGTDAANNTSILYGGSCNAQNAKELFACADIDGGLIGGASLKADDFCKIIQSF
ncbi:MAG TPA: triose-phosphate isomerase [Bacteroidia bacterium]|jgi:triosephosphate isomerase|nr:triose-phosphate isomerase [Bacteroidia bacterium]